MWQPLRLRLSPMVPEIRRLAAVIPVWCRLHSAMSDEAG